MSFWTLARQRAAAMMVLVLGVASCDHVVTSGSSEGPLEPDMPQLVTVTGDDGNSYELIKEPSPGALDQLSVSSVVGILGGVLELDGHKLTIPSGAVLEPTVFTMARSQNGFLEVDLTAIRVTVLGEVIDVGEQGFEKPVTLELTYSRATNVQQARDLVILRLNSGLGGTHEVLPSKVNQGAQMVRAQLDHFSGYCMAQ